MVIFTELCKDLLTGKLRKDSTFLCEQEALSSGLEGLRTGSGAGGQVDFRKLYPLYSE
jgi:hypothetical protein